MNIRLHDYDEAAATLRVKRSWLEHRIKELPHVKLGGTVYFTDEQLLRIVTQFSHDPGQPAAPADAETSQTRLADLRPLPSRARA